jgi:hypothetical protein
VDLSQFLVMAQDYFNAMTMTMSRIIDETREANGLDDHCNIPKELLPAVSSSFQQRANVDAEVLLQQKYDVSAEQFQSLMEKFIASPQVQQSLQMLQLKQQQQFAQMGIVA